MVGFQEGGIKEFLNAEGAKVSQRAQKKIKREKENKKIQEKY
jgi:hypothetical protein